MPLKKSQNKGTSQYGSGITSANGKGGREFREQRNANIIHADDIYAYSNLDYTESLYTKLSSLG